MKALVSGVKPLGPNFLWHLAASSANQTHVGLLGLAATGLAYV